MMMILHAADFTKKNAELAGILIITALNS